MKKIFILAGLLLPFSLFAQQPPPPPPSNSQTPSQISTQKKISSEDTPLQPVQETEGQVEVGEDAPVPPVQVGGNPDEIYSFVEVMPEFPGGQGALATFLAKNCQYPTDAKEAKISGKVFVTFVVGKEGQITEAYVIRNLYPSLDREALRLVKSMPNWKPGMQNGKPVKVKYNLPVAFQSR
jgi:periplasmic protein TonB